MAFGGVELRYTGASWDVYGHFTSELALINNTPHPVFFEAYDANYPALMREYSKGNDHWVIDNDFGPDDLDPRNYPLAAGKSLVVAGSDEPEGASSWRFGIRYALDADPQAHLDHVVWSKVVTSASRNSELSNASSIVKLESRTIAGEKMPFTFVLTNVSQRTFYYLGYKENKTPPSLYLQEEKRFGFWQDEGEVFGDWSYDCKVLGFQALPPGQSKAFSLPPQRNISWRIGIRLFRTADPKAYHDAYSLAWWPAQSPYL